MPRKPDREVVARMPCEFCGEPVELKRRSTGKLDYVCIGAINANGAHCGRSVIFGHRETAAIEARIKGDRSTEPASAPAVPDTDTGQAPTDTSEGEGDHGRRADNRQSGQREGKRAGGGAGAGGDGGGWGLGDW